MQHTFSCRTGSLFVLSVIIAGTLPSQVKIRERVTIAPSADTTRGTHHPLLDKWKALTKNATKINAVSPGKNKTNTVIPVAQSGNAAITVLDGASAAILNPVLRSPVQEVILEDANSHHGFVWDTTGLAG